MGAKRRFKVGDKVLITHYPISRNGRHDRSCVEGTGKIGVIVVVHNNNSFYDYRVKFASHQYACYNYSEAQLVPLTKLGKVLYE